MCAQDKSENLETFQKFLKELSSNQVPFKDIYVKYFNYQEALEEVMHELFADLVNSINKNSLDEINIKRLRTSDIMSKSIFQAAETCGVINVYKVQIQEDDNTIFFGLHEENNHLMLFIPLNDGKKGVLCF